MMINQDIERWVTSLIEEHRFPIIKFDIPHEKSNEIESSGDEEEDNDDDDGDINENISYIASILSSSRVDLRLERCMGVWDPQLRVVTVKDAIQKIPQKMGRRNGDSRLLRPFEALYLMEINRLDIVEEEVSWSMYKAYTVLLSNKADMAKYSVYKKYAAQGLIIELEPNQGGDKEWRKKIKRDTNTPPICTDTASTSSHGFQFRQMCQQLKSLGPRVYDGIKNDENHEEWILHSSDGTSQAVNWMHGEELNTKQMIQSQTTGLFEVPSLPTNFEISSTNVEDVSI